MYDLACENPVFITAEDDGTIMYVFREEMVFFGAEKVSFSELEDEARQELEDELNELERQDNEYTTIL